MDFQYCDRCGDVTTANHAAGGAEFLCPKCAGHPASSAEPRSGLQLLEDPVFGSPASKSAEVSAQDLELFSNDTLVMRRDRPKSTSKLKLVDAREGSSTAEKKPGSAALGSTQPIRAPVGGSGGPADRWRVDCLLCGGSLSVRPVPKRSKLRCPRCHQIMVLDPSGQVSAAGSVAEPRAPRAPAPVAPAAMAPPAPPPPSAAMPKAPAPKAAAPRAAMPKAASSRPSTAMPVAPPPSAALRSGPPAPAQPPAARAAASRGAAPANAGRRPAPAPLGEELDFGTPFATLGSAAPRAGSGSVAIAEPPVTAPVAGGSGIPFAISEDYGLPPTSEGIANPLAEERYAIGASAAPARIPMQGGRPVSTVSSFGSLAWITLALLPSLAAFLAVHEVSGWFGTGLLHGLGETAAENAARLLDWSSTQLDRLTR